jgi:hypothetical protein
MRGEDEFIFFVVAASLYSHCASIPVALTLPISLLYMHMYMTWTVGGMRSIAPGGGRVGSTRTVQLTGGGLEGPAVVPARPRRGAGLRARHVGTVYILSLYRAFGIIS